MIRREHIRALRRAMVIVLATSACGSSEKPAEGTASGSTGAGAAAKSAPGTASESKGAAELTAENLDAYARGITKETELVRAAQDRERSATTPQARGEAAQAQWEDQTIPEGAKSAGLDVDRYRQVRKTVHGVMQTLDFQGKIDGPMELDTARATPAMREQLATDPFDELSPSSRTVLRERMARLVPLWVQYVKLTAVAG